MAKLYLTGVSAPHLKICRDGRSCPYLADSEQHDARVAHFEKWPIHLDRMPCRDGAHCNDNDIWHVCEFMHIAKIREQKWCPFNVFTCYLYSDTDHQQTHLHNITLGQFRKDIAELNHADIFTAVIIKFSAFVLHLEAEYVASVAMSSSQTSSIESDDQSNQTFLQASASASFKTFSTGFDGQAGQSPPQWTTVSVSMSDDGNSVFNENDDEQKNGERKDEGVSQVMSGERVVQMMSEEGAFRVIFGEGDVDINDEMEGREGKEGNENDNDEIEGRVGKECVDDETEGR
jgi:hypothetical protein